MYWETFQWSLKGGELEEKTETFQAGWFKNLVVKVDDLIQLEYKARAPILRDLC